MTNANIILQGQAPQPVNAMMQGVQAGQMVNDVRRTNAMRDLYQQHGAGIASGDQGAMNALAAYDPQAAMQAQATQIGMENTRQGMAQRAQQMQMAVRNEARQVQQMAAQATAAQRAELANEIKSSVSMGLQAQTPEQWDALMQQRNPDMVGMFDMREMLAAEYLSVADSLQSMRDRNAPDGFDSDRYRVVGGSLFDLAADGGPTPVGQGQQPAGLSVTLPDGTEVRQGGPIGTNGKMTEGQGKDIGFASRARDALTTLDGGESPIANSLTSRIDIVLDADPTGLGIGRGFQDPDYQVASNAGTQLLLAILRKDTGAAVTPSEEKMYGNAFLPQPGDGDRLLAQKARAREMAVVAIEEGMGPDQILAQANAIMRTDIAQPRDESIGTPAQEPVVIDGYTITVVE